MRFLQKFGFILLSLLGIVGLVGAQDACPASVDDAILSLNSICLSIGRNQACYGNGDIVAVPQSGTTIDFGVPGDTAIVDDIQSMVLSPFEVGIEEWGIAVLVLQADLPDTLPGQNVTMLLFGDVSLANSGGAYYFTSGIGTPSCNQAPNGVLIQTPEGVGEVNLTMNGINISLGSTAYLGTLDDDILTFALLEGHSTLSIDGSEVELITDEFTTIELDEDGNAIGDFAEPAPIEDLDLPTLPTMLLPDDIDAEDDMDSASASGDRIIPLSGPWSSTMGEFTFSDDCPAFFVDSFNAQSMEQFGVTNGMIQELVFEDEDILGPLFLDLAGPAFEEVGATLTIDETETNIYRVIIGIEGAFTITYTWAVMSDTVIEGTIEQSLAMDPIVCTIETTGVFQYEG